MLGSFQKNKRGIKKKTQTEICSTKECQKLPLDCKQEEILLAEIGGVSQMV